MNYLILGGTGAMGVPLVKNLMLEDESKIYVTSRSQREDVLVDGFVKVHYLQGDAHDIVFLSEIFKNFTFDVVVDFLTYDLENFSSNIGLILGHTARYIFLSSSRVYANSDGPITEDSPRLLEICTDAEYIQINDYPIKKAKEENLLFTSPHKNWTIIRPYLTYNDYRLQLGVYEKEQWLFRALLGKTVLFPKVMADKYTTLTHAEDVVACICKLINSSNTYANVYQIMTSETMTWKNIINIYTEAIEDVTGVKPIFEYIDDYQEIIELLPVKYVLEYDRLFNRSFNNRKLLSTIDNYSFIETKKGLKDCINNFAKKPQWICLFGKYEAWSDKLCKEYTNIRLFDSIKQKIIYCINRL